MTQLFGLLGCLALITGSGAALGTLLHRRVDDLHAPLGFGWSFLLGTAAVSAALHLPLALTGHLPQVVYQIVLAACALATGWFVWRRWDRHDLVYDVRQGWLFDCPKAVRYAVLLFGLFACASAAIMPMNTYDGRAAFAMKARVLFDTETIRNEDFQDVDRLHFNAHYPLLIPLVLAETYSAQGTMNDIYTRIVFAFFVAALISIVVGELRRHMSRRSAALWGLVLMLTPMVTTTFEGGGLSASADIPMACFLTAAVIEVGQWLREQSLRRALTAGFLLGAACMTKGEGNIWILAMAAALAALLGWRGVRPRRDSLGSAVAGGAMLVCMFAISGLARRYVPHSPYLREYTQAFRLDWLSQLWARPFAVATYCVSEALRIGHWNLLWPVLIGAFVLLRRRGDRTRVSDEIWYMRLVVALVFAADLAIFVITPYHVHFQLRTALCRLALQFVPLVTIVLAEQVMASGWIQELVEEWKTPRINPADDEEADQNLLYYRAEGPPTRRAG